MILVMRLEMIIHTHFSIVSFNSNLFCSIIFIYLPIIEESSIRRDEMETELANGNNDIEMTDETIPQQPELSKIAS
jgi:hypothetical protein